MTVNVDILDRLAIDHGVFKRVRMACQHAAKGIDLDQHALLVAGLVCSLNHEAGSNDSGRRKDASRRSAAPAKEDVTT